MGSSPVKKTPSKTARSTAQARRSASKATKNDGSPVKTPTRRSAKKAAREYNYTSIPPNEQQRSENGRVPGRSLIVWGRPRMAEKLLLHLQYECARYKIELPWNNIAHRLKPGSTGAAVNQHLARLRRELIAEGHLVPPVLPRPGGAAVDHTIRGYVRKDEQGDDKLETRAVRFNERVDDRKFNLPDALDVRDQMIINLDSDDEEVNDSDDELSDCPAPIQQTHEVPSGNFHQFTEPEVAQPVHVEPVTSIEVEDEANPKNTSFENDPFQFNQMDFNSLPTLQKDDVFTSSQNVWNNPQNVIESPEKPIVPPQVRQGYSATETDDGTSTFVPSVSHVRKQVPRRQTQPVVPNHGLGNMFRFPVGAPMFPPSTEQAAY
ncbi:chaperonin [Neonectria punicea]|uniref:Chaperonin n=1 Tax=Neonectria punicea TaxID=979145 RepID=A0ABR1H7X2_9HYPO